MFNNSLKILRETRLTLLLLVIFLKIFFTKSLKF